MLELTRCNDALGHHLAELRDLEAMTSTLSATVGILLLLLLITSSVCVVMTVEVMRMKRAQRELSTEIEDSDLEELVLAHDALGNV